ncbi:hypothetical protein PIJ50_10265 [Falsirhodobacter sp. 20TX0035]|nr:hypothetical protein [Falsirhodobacter sp. 20TX0035]MDB6454041.1 hypothetical protein [Falsirhodobacter sp. 20TX0035]
MILGLNFCAAIHRVGARAAPHCVIARAAQDQIVAGRADQVVGARVTPDRTVARTAVDPLDIRCGESVARMIAKESVVALAVLEDVHIGIRGIELDRRVRGSRGRLRRSHS